MSGSAPRRLTLGRAQRLQGARAFAALKAEGERRVSGCLVVNWRRREPGVAGPSRVGFVTSRRIGGAVARNRARRLMREAYRLNQHALQAPVDLVLVARASVVTMPLEGVCNDLRRALRGSGLLKPSPGPA